jgi:hypothetical protein
MPDDRPPIQYPQPRDDPKIFLQSKRMDLEAGWVGRITGSGKNAPTNVAFVLVVLLLVLAGILSFLYPSDRLDLLKTVIPVVTLTLGYLFGKNSGT